jgi:hypothetical protein
MTSEAQQVAERLLDAQVAHLLAELSGPTGARIVAAEVRHLLDDLEDATIDELVERDGLVATAGSLLDAVGDSPAIGAMVATLAPVLHELPASDDQPLGELVDRASVEAVVDLLVRSRPLREEALRRLGQSPAVSVLAMRFVTALVGDAVQQNRERVEKVPGAKSLLGMGDFAARQARGMAPKQLEKMVGGAADKGTQAAMERVSRALLDTFDEEAVRTAAMEVWDLHAEDDVAGLRAYVTRDEVEHVAANGHEVWLGLHATPWFGAVVDAAIDGFLDVYGQHTLGDVLGEFGLDPALLATEAERHAPHILAALHRTGHLEAALRRRLEPFFRSEAALAILDQTS